MKLQNYSRKKKCKRNILRTEFDLGNFELKHGVRSYANVHTRIKCDCNAAPQIFLFAEHCAAQKSTITKA